MKPRRPFDPSCEAPRPWRTNRPAREAKREGRRIVAVSMRDREAIVEGGELLSLEELAFRLAERSETAHGDGFEGDEFLEPALIVTDRSVDLLGFLQSWAAPAGRRVKDSPFWQFRITPRDHSPWRPEAKAKQHVVQTRAIVDWFGFGTRHRTTGKRHGKRRNRYFHVLDVAFFSDAVSRLIEGQGGGARALLELGTDIRAFCNENRLPMARSAGAFGVRLLKDHRFWPEPRRKVPKATNKRAREHLPGNHYKLLTDPMKRHAKVHYLDLRAAHHSAAMRVRFPSSDWLWARGCFRDPPTDGEGATGWRDRPWAWERGSPCFEHVIFHHLGLLCVVLNVTRDQAQDPFALPCCKTMGRTYRYVYSCELPELERQGIRIEAIVACWTSPDADEGLSEFAWWAQEHLEEAGEYRRQWLKPALLAAYGVLASVPRRFRTAYRQAVKGDRVTFGTAFGDPIWALERSTTSEQEPRTANVVWRGLIEAWTRIECLSYARELDRAGFRVLGIWADGLFVEDDGRELPARSCWRSKGILHDLRFYSATHLASKELTRLPGITGEVRERLLSGLRSVKSRPVDSARAAVALSRLVAPEDHEALSAFAFTDKVSA